MHSFTLAVALLVTPVLFSADPPSPAKASPERAFELLESAGGVIAGTPPEFQAGALLRLAQVELAADKRTSSLDHLNQSFAATAALPSLSDYRVREEIQSMVASVTARVDLERAAEMIFAIQPASGWDKDQRVAAVDAIVRELLRMKKTAEAVSVLDRFGPDGVLPFQALGELLKTLPPEDERRMALCSQALAAFRRRPDIENFNIYLRNFRKQIPQSIYAASVLALAHATMDKKGLPRPLLFSVTTPKGTISVRDPYDSVLFQMLDLVQEIDPELARRIVSDRPGLQSILQRYPNGQASLQADGEAVTTWTDAEGPEGKPSADQQQRASVVALEGLKVQQAMTALRTDPGKYLDIVREIPTARLRTRMIGTLAMYATGRPPEEGKPILEKCVAELKEVKDTSARATTWVTLANAANRLKEREIALKALEQAMIDAKEELQADADTGSPNLAPKSLWPSTATLRAVFYRAGEILGADAELLLEKVADLEMQSIGRVEIAAQWLGAPQSPMYSKVRRKK